MCYLCGAIQSFVESGQAVAPAIFSLGVKVWITPGWLPSTERQDVVRGVIFLSAEGQANKPFPFPPRRDGFYFTPPKMTYNLMNFILFFFFLYPLELLYKY